METKYHIYGDESIIADTIVYGLVIIPVEHLAYVEQCLDNIKKKYRVPVTSRIHCKTLFHNDARKHTRWKHLTFEMVYDLLFQITSDLAGKGLATRVGHIEKKDVIYPLQAPGNHPPMTIDNLKQLIPFAYLGAMGQIVYDQNYSDKWKLWIDPNSDLIPWFGKRKQIERAFSLIDLERKFDKTAIPENLESKERPMQLEIADILAYCAARVLSNSGEKVRLSDRICESLYNSMNPHVGRFRQIDPMETKDIFL